MKVDAICTGTVIDHIRAGQALRVVELLRLPEKPVMTIGQNLASGKHGAKDIVKIEGHELSQSEVDTVAIIAPEATLSIIRDYTVVAKHAVTLPARIPELIVCPNPRCVTNCGGATTLFAVETKSTGGPVLVRCHYCEKRYDVSEVRIDIGER